MRFSNLFWRFLYAHLFFIVVIACSFSAEAGSAQKLINGVRRLKSHSIEDYQQLRTFVRASRGNVSSTNRYIYDQGVGSVSFRSAGISDTREAILDYFVPTLYRKSGLQNSPVGTLFFDHWSEIGVRAHMNPADWASMGTMSKAHIAGHSLASTARAADFAGALIYANPSGFALKVPARLRNIGRPDAITIYQSSPEKLQALVSAVNAYSRTTNIHSRRYLLAPGVWSTNVAEIAAATSDVSRYDLLRPYAENLVEVNQALRQEWGTQRYMDHLTSMFPF